MPSYVCLIQFKDQGIRNIQDTVKRGDAAIAEAKKMGMQIVEEYWNNGRLRCSRRCGGAIGGKIPAEVRHSDHNETATWLSRGIGCVDCRE